MKLYFVVKNLLETEPETRDSDRLMIWRVWEKLGFINMFANTIEKSSFMNAPHTESIRRLRQKLQEKNPELRSSGGVQTAKNEKQSTAGNFVYHEVIEERPRISWDTMRKQIEERRTAETLEGFKRPIDKR